MWDLIRKHQGLSPNECPYDTMTPIQRYGKNQNCMLLHEARPDIPPSNPREYSRAYGEFNFEKIRRWMLDEDARVRIQAVDELIDMYVERREYAIVSLKYHLLEILISLLTTDEQPEIRERAGTALEILLREHSAQRALLALPDDPFDLLLKALEDTSDGVIVVTLRSFIAAHSYSTEFEVTASLVEHGGVDRYIDLLRHPNSVVVAVTCAAFIPLLDLKEMNVTFLRMGGVSLVTQALSSSDAMTITEAAELLHKACETAEGRREAVQCGAIEALTQYVSHENLSARVAVCSALAQITVLEEARFQSVDFHLPQALLTLLASEDERDVLAHVARLLIHLGEYPKARELLRVGIPRLEELVQLSGEDITVRVPLQTAIRTLSRK